MKNYKEMAEDVFRRREEFLRKRRRRNQILLRTGALSGFCVLLLSAGILVPAMTGNDYTPGTADAPMYNIPDETSELASANSEEFPKPGNTADMQSPADSEPMDPTPAVPDETSGEQFGDADPLPPDLPSTEDHGDTPSVPETGDDPVVPATGDHQNPSEGEHRPSEGDQRPSLGGPSEPENNVAFSSYEELNQALRDENSDVWQDLNDFGSDEALFQSFLSGFSGGELRLLIPMMSGERLELGDRDENNYITLFSYELHDLPWIRYHCMYQESDLIIQIAYPQILNNPEIDLGGSYLDLLDVIAPEAANPLYYLDKGYAAVYETNMILGDGKTVSVFMLKSNNGGMLVSFLYEGVIVMARADEMDLLSEEFFGEFSMKELN